MMKLKISRDDHGGKASYRLCLAHQDRLKIAQCHFRIRHQSFEILKIQVRRGSDVGDSVVSRSENTLRFADRIEIQLDEDGSLRARVLCLKDDLDVVSCMPLLLAGSIDRPSYHLMIRTSHDVVISGHVDMAALTIRKAKAVFVKGQLHLASLEVRKARQLSLTGYCRTAQGVSLDVATTTISGQMKVGTRLDARGKRFSLATGSRLSVKGSLELYTDKVDIRDEATVETCHLDIRNQQVVGYLKVAGQVKVAQDCHLELHALELFETSHIEAATFMAHTIVAELSGRVDMHKGTIQAFRKAHCFDTCRLQADQTFTMIVHQDLWLHGTFIAQEGLDVHVKGCLDSLHAKTQLFSRRFIGISAQSVVFSGSLVADGDIFLRSKSMLELKQTRIHCDRLGLFASRSLSKSRHTSIVARVTIELASERLLDICDARVGTFHQVSDSVYSSASGQSASHHITARYLSAGMERGEGAGALSICAEAVTLLDSCAASQAQTLLDVPSNVIHSMFRGRSIIGHWKVRVIEARQLARFRHRALAYDGAPSLDSLSSATSQALVPAHAVKDRSLQLDFSDCDVQGRLSLVLGGRDVHVIASTGTQVDALSVGGVRHLSFGRRLQVSCLQVDATGAVHVLPKSALSLDQLSLRAKAFRHEGAMLVRGDCELRTAQPLVNRGSIEVGGNAMLDAPNLENLRQVSDIRRGDSRILRAEGPAAYLLVGGDAHVTGNLSNSASVFLVRGTLRFDGNVFNTSFQEQYHYTEVHRRYLKRRRCFGLCSRTVVQTCFIRRSVYGKIYPAVLAAGRVVSGPDVGTIHNAGYVFLEGDSLVEAERFLCESDLRPVASHPSLGGSRTWSHSHPRLRDQAVAQPHDARVLALTPLTSDQELRERIGSDAVTRATVHVDKSLSMVTQFFRLMDRMVARGAFKLSTHVCRIASRVTRASVVRDRSRRDGMRVMTETTTVPGTGVLQAGTVDIAAEDFRQQGGAIVATDGDVQLEAASVTVTPVVTYKACQGQIHRRGDATYRRPVIQPASIAGRNITAQVTSWLIRSSIMMAQKKLDIDARNQLVMEGMSLTYAGPRYERRGFLSKEVRTSSHAVHAPGVLRFGSASLKAAHTLRLSYVDAAGGSLRAHAKCLKMGTVEQRESFSHQKSGFAGFSWRNDRVSQQTITPLVNHFRLGHATLTGQDQISIVGGHYEQSGRLRVHTRKLMIMPAEQRAYMSRSSFSIGISFPGSRALGTMFSGGDAQQVGLALLTEDPLVASLQRWLTTPGLGTVLSELGQTRKLADELSKALNQQSDRAWHYARYLGWSDKTAGVLQKRFRPKVSVTMSSSQTDMQERRSLPTNFQAHDIELQVERDAHLTDVRLRSDQDTTITVGGSLSVRPGYEERQIASTGFSIEAGMGPGAFGPSLSLGVDCQTDCQRSQGYRSSLITGRRVGVHVGRDLTLAGSLIQGRQSVDIRARRVDMSSMKGRQERRSLSTRMTSEQGKLPIGSFSAGEQLHEFACAPAGIVAPYGRIMTDEISLRGDSRLSSERMLCGLHRAEPIIRRQDMHYRQHDSVIQGGINANPLQAHESWGPSFLRLLQVLPFHAWVATKTRHAQLAPDTRATNMSEKALHWKTSDKFYLYLPSREHWQSFEVLYDVTQACKPPPREVTVDAWLETIDLDAMINSKDALDPSEDEVPNELPPSLTPSDLDIDPLIDHDRWPLAEARLPAEAVDAASEASEIRDEGSDASDFLSLMPDLALVFRRYYDRFDYSYTLMDRYDRQSMKRVFSLDPARGHPSLLITPHPRVIHRSRNPAGIVVYEAGSAGVYVPQAFHMKSGTGIHRSASPGLYGAPTSEYNMVYRKGAGGIYLPQSSHSKSGLELARPAVVRDYAAPGAGRVYELSSSGLYVPRDHMLNLSHKQTSYLDRVEKALGARIPRKVRQHGNRLLSKISNVNKMPIVRSIGKHAAKAMLVVDLLDATVSFCRKEKLKGTMKLLKTGVKYPVLPVLGNHVYLAIVSGSVGGLAVVAGVTGAFAACMLAEVAIEKVAGLLEHRIALPKRETIYRPLKADRIKEDEWLLGPVVGNKHSARRVDDQSLLIPRLPS